MTNVHGKFGSSPFLAVKTENNDESNGCKKKKNDSFEWNCIEKGMMSGKSSDPQRGVAHIHVCKLHAVFSAGNETDHSHGELANDDPES